ENVRGNLARARADQLRQAPWHAGRVRITVCLSVSASGRIHHGSEYRLRRRRLSRCFVRGVEMSNKIERIKALLAGERVHPPVASFFGHKHALEQSPETLVPHLIEQNKLFGWDFIKVQSRATY